MDFVAAFRRVIMVDDDVDDGEDDGDAGDGQHDGSVDSDDRVTHASTLFSTLCYILSHWLGILLPCSVFF